MPKLAVLGLESLDFTSNFNILWIYGKKTGNYKIMHLLHELSNWTPFVGEKDCSQEMIANFFKYEQFD
jgi:hypothetical protein